MFPCRQVESPPGPSDSPGATVLRIACSVAIVLAAVTAAVGLSLFCATGYRDSSSQFTKIGIIAINEQLMMYAVKHHGEYPAELADMTRYFPNQEAPVDSWGRPFLYLHQPGAPDFFVVSLGADGMVGGENEDTDIRSDRLFGG